MALAIDKGAMRVHHLALISMIIGFLAGYDSGVAGGILSFPSFQRDFGYSKAEQNRVNSLTVGLQVLGCFLSCFWAGWVTERVGRRWAVWAFSAVFIIGVILQTVPTRNLVAWYIARLVSGIGQGGLSIAIPIFTAEMAPAHIRGRLGSFYQWMFTLGIFTAYWVNYGMPLNYPGVQSKQWQIPVALQMISSSILFLGMFTVPESVRWLLKKGRKEEAWKSLVWIRADSGTLVEEEFKEMQEGLEMEQEAKAGLRLKEVLVGENRSRVISGSLSFLFQQGTGGSALAYFSPQFFQLLVGKGQRDLLLTALFGAVKLAACTAFVLFLASKVGRRVPLITGAIFMFCCMLPIAVILRTTTIPANADALPVSPTSTATIALVFMNVMAYNLSWGPLPWVYVPEIFPNRTRELGVSICLTVHWLFNFVFTFSTPYMIDGGTGPRGWGTFLFYAIFDLVMALWAFVFMKETKNKTLERVNLEIDADKRALTTKQEALETGDDARPEQAAETTGGDSDTPSTPAAPEIRDI